MTYQQLNSEWDVRGFAVCGLQEVVFCNAELKRARVQYIIHNSGECFSVNQGNNSAPIFFRRSFSCKLHMFDNKVQLFSDNFENLLCMRKKQFSKRCAGLIFPAARQDFLPGNSKIPGRKWNLAQIYFPWKKIYQNGEEYKDEINHCRE